MKFWIRLWNEQTGQATTEYILILSVVVSMVVMVLKKFLGPAFAKLMTAVSNQLDNQFLGADLHTFRIRR